MTGRSLVTTHRADEDIVAAIDYLVAQGASHAATLLVEELESAFELVVRHPEIGSPRFMLETGIAGLRHVALSSSRYLIFCLAIEPADGDPVTIVRVLHTSRDIPAELRP